MFQSLFARMRPRSARSGCFEPAGIGSAAGKAHGHWQKSSQKVISHSAGGLSRSKKRSAFPAERFSCQHIS
ncbi:hypothetical protein CLOLEP_00702 [[Clostridium] leptum DSM 753]|uniref:Uncharacterized protein n=1 Tax=[Clostridium] leptum DSM 753 TaxID=428125 RepID=A7VQ75_9FIRM|nr:hypothetical protein CLOLEP_00702 [[Clostridium] leptum DSM 753]